MARKFFRKYLPSADRIKNDRLLKRFGSVLHQPSLWHLNRHSVARGVAVGLFWAWIPLPLQSPFSIACAIKVRGNVPLAYVMTWISNPLTLLPSVYVCYQIGAFVTGREPVGRVVHDIIHQPGWRASRAYVRDNWTIVWPFFPGCIIFGLMCSVVGYLAVHLLWRWNLIRRMNARGIRLKRNALIASKPIGLLGIPFSSRNLQASPKIADGAK